MPTAQKSSPNAGTSDNRTGSIVWSAPADGVADNDETFGTAANNANADTEYLLAADYEWGATLPADATIIGLAVKPVCKASHNSGANNVTFNSVRIAQASDGAFIGDDKASEQTGNWATGKTGYTFGDENSDQWGVSGGLLRSHFDGANFGVAVSASIVSDGTTVTASVDYIQCTVRYGFGDGLEGEAFLTMMIGTP